jgi:hypothetical protein
MRHAQNRLKRQEAISSAADRSSIAILERESAAKIEKKFYVLEAKFEREKITLLQQ